MSEIQYKLAHALEMPREGEIIAERYRIQGVLGEGGFAAVFRAFDTRVDQDVAIKVLDPMMSRRPQFAARFDREIRTVSSLKHPNTISVTDRGTTDRGCLYLVMELLEGVPLDEELERNGPLTEERVVRVAIQLLKSLSEAHEKGIMHRDIKPANIFLTELAGEKDFIKVLDFGIAKSLDDQGNDNLTQTGELMCSPHYVAPERVRETKTFPASDIYSVGVMMIELLTGKPPVDGESPMTITIQHAMMDQPVPIPPEVEVMSIAPVLRAAVAKPIDQRYTSALQMVEDLQAIQRGAPALNAASLQGTQELKSAPSTSSFAALSPSDPTLISSSGGKRNTTLAVMVVAAVIVLGAAGALVKLIGSPDATPASVEPTPTPAASAELPLAAAEEAPAVQELAIPIAPSAATTEPTAAELAQTVSAARAAAEPVVPNAQAITASVVEANEQPAPAARATTRQTPARARPEPEPRRAQVDATPRPTPAPSEPVAAQPTVATPPVQTPEPTPAPARPSRFTREIAPR